MTTRPVFLITEDVEKLKPRLATAIFGNLIWRDLNCYYSFWFN